MKTEERWDGFAKAAVSGLFSKEGLEKCLLIPDLVARIAEVSCDLADQMMLRVEANKEKEAKARRREEEEEMQEASRAQARWGYSEPGSLSLLGPTAEEV